MTERMTERYSPVTWYDRAVHKTPHWSPLPENSPPIDLALKLPEGVKISKFGVVLPEELGYDDWVSIGRMLIAIGACVLWALGEWWAFGRHEYAHRAMIAEKLPYDFKYLCNLGWVARSVPTSSRNELLSFTHHMKVAKLTPNSQEIWLEKAVKGKWSAATLEQEIRKKEKGDAADADHEAEQNDPEGYRKAKARKAGADAIYQFGKVLNADVNHHVQAIQTDPEFLADLDDRMLARLLNEAIGKADVFNEVVRILEQEQKRRSVRDGNADDSTEEADFRSETETPKTSIKRERMKTKVKRLRLPKAA